MKTLILVLLVNVVGICQTAQVVPLSYQDVQRVSEARAVLDKAQGDWDVLRKDIEHRYVSDSHEEISIFTTGTLLPISSNSSTYLSAYGRSDAEESCIKVTTGKFEVNDIQLCRKLMELRSKSKAEQDVEAAKEKDRVSKIPKITVYSLKQNWGNGFEFSEDFHYLVPHVPAPTTGCNQFPNWTTAISR